MLSFGAVASCATASGIIIVRVVIDAPPVVRPARPNGS